VPKRSRQLLDLDSDNVIAMPRRRGQAKFQEERAPPPLRALTENQGHYIASLQLSEQIVVMGPAGTGKTFIAGTHAADRLRSRQVSKIVITRPNVPGGRSLGFFPGTLEEKIAPWVVPLTETIKERMGAGAFEIALKRGDIEIVPFEVMRGRTFKDAIVILDEAQNTTPVEIKMFLTRVGNDCQVIINGDVSQTDLKETSGLRTILNLINNQDLGVPVIEFTRDDIVRSGVCEMWVKAFDNAQI
jgi:phosphate starvation-inducible PhoH-like protein